MINIFLLLILLIIFLFVGVPVALSMGIISVVYWAFLTDFSWALITQRIVLGADSFTLMAIPFFILAGSLMNASGVTEKIFNFANNLVGFIPGGLGHVNIGASVLFAGMSGSMVADAAGLGKVEIDAMTKRGFPASFSAIITAASATIGPIIPPSIIFVVYGGLTGASIGHLFLAGIVPGLLMALYLMIAVYIISKKRNYPKEPFPEMKVLFKSFIVAIPPLLTPVIIVGGILGGVFTPTESAVAASVYSFILGVFFYRNLSLKNLKSIFFEVANTTAVLMFILAVANLFSYILIREGLGAFLASMVTSIAPNATIFLLLMLPIFLFLGLFMSPVTNLVIVMPILLPILTLYEIDIVFFGVIATITLALGTMTPPVGLSMYTVCKIAGISVGDFIKEMPPFLFALLLSVITLIFIPGIVTFLPKLFDY